MTSSCTSYANACVCHAYVRANARKAAAVKRTAVLYFAGKHRFPMDNDCNVCAMCNVKIPAAREYS